MGRPKNYNPNLKERLIQIKKAGIENEIKRHDHLQNIESLSDRLKMMMGIIRDKPIKATEMFYLIMYDIEDNKVRTEIAKYLIKKGCIRIQKSVYFAKTESKMFSQICSDLKEVQEAYENEDSIIIAPVNHQTLGSMRVYGKNLQIDILAEKPNTLFF